MKNICVADVGFTKLYETDVYKRRDVCK